MKILFIAHNNRLGGALQNVLNFCIQACSDDENEFFFILPNNAKADLSKYLPLDDLNVLFIEKNKGIFLVNKLVRNIINEFQPDVLYTMAGPNYILKSNVIAVQGVSDAFITHAEFKSYFKNRTFFSGVYFYLLRLFKGFVLRFTSDKIIFQTISARDSYCRRFMYPMSDTFVIPNSINPWLLNSKAGVNSLWVEPSKNNRSRDPQLLRILIPCIDYPHKNIEFISKILSCKDFTHRVQFILTLPPTSRILDLLKRSSTADKEIINRGLFSPDESLQVYLDSDIVFLPSVCETFSTSYIEAMAVSKPLIVPEFSFSKEICEDYACYYRSDDVSDFIRAFEVARSQTGESNRRKATAILEKYGSQSTRYDRIIHVLGSLIS